MAVMIFFDCFALDMGEGKHDFAVDTCKVYLSNVAPISSNTVYNTPADLATAGGYTAGGESILNTWTASGGVASLLAGANLLWTASSGFGPFRYAILYNFTSSTKPLIAWWDCTGAPITIVPGGTFSGTFGAAVLTAQPA